MSAHGMGLSHQTPRSWWRGVRIDTLHRWPVDAHSAFAVGPVGEVAPLRRVSPESTGGGASQVVQRAPDVVSR